jgi:hypothetical protein
MNCSDVRHFPQPRLASNCLQRGKRGGGNGLLFSHLADSPRRPIGVRLSSEATLTSSMMRIDPDPRKLIHVVPLSFRLSPAAL